MKLEYLWTPVYHWMLAYILISDISIKMLNILRGQGVSWKDKMTNEEVGRFCSMSCLILKLIFFICKQLNGFK